MLKIVVVAKSIADWSKNTKNLQKDHVVGEDVRVACCCPCWYRALMPPLLETHVEDEDVEWEEEDEVDEGVGGVHDMAGKGVMAS